MADETDGYPPPPDEPPPGLFDEEPPPAPPGAPADAGSRPDGAPAAAGSDEPPLHVTAHRVVRRVLAGLDGTDRDEVLAMLRQIRSSTAVLDALTAGVRRTLTGVLEVLDHEAANIAAGAVSLAELPVAAYYNDAVQAEIAAVAALADNDAGAANPTGEWLALCEGVQRATARGLVAQLADALDAKAPAEELVTAYKALEPPTIQRQGTGISAVRTARQWQERDEALRAGRPRLRLSSGYRSLDVSATAPGEPLGWIAPGEFKVKAAGTGQGKTSDGLVSVPAGAQDLVNWGLPDARVLLAHTEEEPETKVGQLQLGRGQRFHHLADQIAIAEVGTQLTKLVQAIYDLTIEAVHRAEATGRPVTDFLLHLLYVDYIQKLRGRGGQSEQEGVEQAADFLLYGVAAWNFDEMAVHGGIDFPTYAGMNVPEGMDGHRVAVVSYAQLRKQEGERQFYLPGNKRTPKSEFVIEAPDGSDGWEVAAGDLRIPTEDEIRGSGVLLQHSSEIIFLHRSKPKQNVIREPGADPYLADTRARFVLAKTRLSVGMPFVPMAFDSAPGRNKGQYFDYVAEEMMRQGRFTPDESWQQPGDPILPQRPAPEPLAGVRY